MAKTSLSAFVAAIAPKSRRIVDDRREEVDREDERALVVEPVDGRVVRRVEADEQVLRLGRDEAAQQLLEPRGRVLRRAPAGREAVSSRHPAASLEAGKERRRPEGRRREGERNDVTAD